VTFEKQRDKFKVGRAQGGEVFQSYVECVVLITKYETEAD